MGFLYIALFGTLLMWLGFRPRKPKLIYAQRNRTFLRMFFAFSIITIGAPLWLYAGTVFPEQLLDHIGLGAFIIGVLSIIAMLYVLVFSQPTNRWKPRSEGLEEIADQYGRYIEEVDKRQPEVMGLYWAPDFIVDGKRYNMISYGLNLDGSPLPMLAFDEEGKVITDRALMNKIVRCLYMANGIVQGLEGVNDRVGNYDNVRKAVKQIERGLRIYESLVAPLNASPGSDLAKNIAEVKHGLEMALEYSKLVLHDWHNEAQWEHDHNGTKIEEIVYDDMLALAAQLKAIEYMRDHEKEIGAAWLARRHLINPMKEYRGKPKQAAELETLFGVIDVYFHALPDLKNWPKKGPIIKYQEMSEEEERLWRERLEWVDRVDGWIAEGFSGVELERKKLNWQIEQEGLILPEEAKKRLHKKGILE